jgi:hypothetical protein
MSQYKDQASRNCSVGQQHTIGIRWFVFAGITLLVGIFVAFAEAIFGVTTIYTYGIFSIFSLIGLIIELFFILFLILGIYSYFRCSIKKAVSQ